MSEKPKQLVLKPGTMLTIAIPNESWVHERGVARVKVQSVGFHRRRDGHFDEKMVEAVLVPTEAPGTPLGVGLYIDLEMNSQEHEPQQQYFYRMLRMMFVAADVRVPNTIDNDDCERLAETISETKESADAIPDLMESNKLLTERNEYLKGEIRRLQSIGLSVADVTLDAADIVAKKNGEIAGLKAEVKRLMDEKIGVMEGMPRETPKGENDG